jgi:hypothetical protein
MRNFQDHVLYVLQQKAKGEQEEDEVWECVSEYLEINV